jgi:hypothetical protein
VAIFDYDGDGLPDIYLPNGSTLPALLGKEKPPRAALYHNLGNWKFEDVTDKAGVANERWGMGVAVGDYDNDGRPDLYVTNFGVSRLYHNNGDGTFADVSVASGIAAHKGKGMGIAIADYDHDGLMDIFVANDTMPNFLFHNEGGGRFREVALASGVGLNDDGKALSSMGADFRDLDNDGWEDLAITALTNQTFPVFRNLGRGLFREITYSSHVGAITAQLSGWSMGIFDFDNNGWKDIFAAGGDVQDNTEMLTSGKSRQQDVLLMNDAKGAFHGVPVGPPALNRGVAFGDFDRDGRVDAIVTRLNEPPVLLRNVMGAGNHWLGLKLIGEGSNRDAIGARVTVRSGAATQVNRVTTSTGYACASELAVHFGLGRSLRAESIEIEWPSGSRQSLTNVAADSYVTVRERLPQ